MHRNRWHGRQRFLTRSHNPLKSTINPSEPQSMGYLHRSGPAMRYPKRHSAAVEDLVYRDMSAICGLRTRSRAEERTPSELHKLPYHTVGSLLPAIYGDSSATSVFPASCHALHSLKGNLTWFSCVHFGNELRGKFVNHANDMCSTCTFRVPYHRLRHGSVATPFRRDVVSASLTYMLP